MVHNIKQLEGEYLQKLIDYYAIGIEMAEICQEKTLHSELKKTCEEISERLQDKSGMFSSWLKEWYGADYDPKIPLLYQSRITDLEKLEGEKLEETFLKYMINLDEELQEIISGTCFTDFHREIGEQCDDVSDKLASETEQLKRWLCKWHKVC